MNPAIVAAALNQWGLLNGMQPNQGNNDQVSENSSFIKFDCHHPHFRHHNFQTPLD